MNKKYITDVKTDKISLQEYYPFDNPEQARRLLYAISKKIKSDHSYPIELRTWFANGLQKIALSEKPNAKPKLVSLIRLR